MFAFASATGSDIERLAAELIGVEESEIVAITDDGSPHGEVRMQLWQPERTVESDASALLAELAADGRQTIAFTPSRRMSELVALRARDQLSEREVVGGEVPRIESYRGGYLAADRRAVERALLDRSIMGVAATNALELGIDIAGMDAVIMAGFPGSRAAMWQQAGRAGRRGGDADVIIMMQPDPLDQLSR